MNIIGTAGICIIAILRSIPYNPINCESFIRESMKKSIPKVSIVLPVLYHSPFSLSMASCDAYAETIDSSRAHDKGNQEDDGVERFAENGLISTH